MVAVSGYIDNSSVITDENISSYDGHRVIITILDGTELMDDHIGEGDKIEAARDLAGLWEDRDLDMSIDNEVRELRRGRRFDI